MDVRKNWEFVAPSDKLEKYGHTDVSIRLAPTRRRMARCGVVSSLACGDFAYLQIRRFSCVARISILHNKIRTLIRYSVGLHRQRQ